MKTNYLSSENLRSLKEAVATVKKCLAALAVMLLCVTGAAAQDVTWLTEGTLNLTNGQTVTAGAVTGNLTINVPSGAMGIQQSLLAAYIRMSKKPSIEREEEIYATIRQIGKELSAI